MRLIILLLMSTALLQGCGTASGNADLTADRLAVPAPKQYTPAQYDQAADELQTWCSKIPMVCQMMIDAGKMRTKARIALGI